MIAHRIQRKTGKDKFEKLACYIVNVSHVQDPRVFERLASYVVDRKGDGERVVGTRITNCGSDDFEWAVREIQATQAQNTRSRADKSYHLVISFPEGERPTPEQLRDIEDELVASIGLSEHQRISAVHDDTDNLHIHVAINKVHPTTLRCVEPHYDKQKLMAACVELELKHGLVRDNHGAKAEKARTQSEDKMHAHAGRETLREWIMANAKEPVTAALATAKTWQDLHMAFAAHGLEIRPYGAGLVIGPPGQRTTIKASDLGREFGVQALTARFGPYERPGPECSNVKPERQYTRAPRQKSPEAEALFKRYQAEREAALAARAFARVELEQRHAAYSAELRRHHASRLAAIRAEVHLRAHEKRAMRGDLAVERKRDWAERRAAVKLQRQQLDAANPLLTWNAFLEREATSGNEHALAALRAQETSRSRLAEDILTAADLRHARQYIDRSVERRARKNGDVQYSVKDGGRVTDRAGEVRLDQLSAGAAVLALTIAAERFGDQALILEGSDAFKAALVRAAALPGLSVRFADPELEAARQIAVKEREILAATRPDQGTAAGYVAERNAQRERFADIPEHRLWAPEDAGAFVYAGRRAFADGTEAVLLKRGEALFVKPSTDAQVAKASKWKRGRTVIVDAQGRFRSEERARSASASVEI